MLSRMFLLIWAALPFMEVLWDKLLAHRALAKVSLEVWAPQWEALVASVPLEAVLEAQAVVLVAKKTKNRQ